MTTGEIVGSVFFAADELLGVEELAVCTGPHFIDDGGLKIYENGTGDVLASTSFAEKGVEGIVSSSNCLVAWHLAIGLGKETTNFNQN